MCRLVGPIEHLKVNDRLVCSIRGMTNYEGNGNIGRKLSQCHFISINLKWTTLRRNPEFKNEKPVTINMKYCMYTQAHTHTYSRLSIANLFIPGTGWMI
jgi:hypothetical protein